jgi:hypothetical protein
MGKDTQTFSLEQGDGSGAGRFIGRFLGMVVVCGLLAAVIGAATKAKTVPAWGHPMKEHKWFAVRNDSVETVVLGTSHVQQGFDAPYFDSLMMTMGAGNFKTYNYGVPGMFTPENYALLGELLADSSFRPKRIFAEVLHTQPPKLVNANNTRVKRWFSGRWAAYLWKEQLEAPGASNTLYRIGYAGITGLTYLATQYNFGLTRKTIYTRLKSDLGWNEAPMSPQGYYLDTAYAANHALKPKLWKELGRVVEGSRKATQTQAVAGEASEQQLALLESYQKMAKARGIELVYVVMPRVSPGKWQGVRGLIGAFKTRPALGELIVMADPDKYPSLYTRESARDPYHFNRQGARLFTEFFAKEVNNRLKSNPTKPQ